MKFRDCVEICEIMDMKHSGSTFTWNNKQEGEDRVFSKIDRSMINLEWASTFQGAETIFLPEGIFDHCPAIVRFLLVSMHVAKPFRYFNMLSTLPDFQINVKRSLDAPIQGTFMFTMMAKLKRLKVFMKDLNRGKFSNIELQFEAAKKEAKHHPIADPELSA